MKHATIFRLALLSMVVLAILAFVISTPRSAFAVSEGQSYYQDLGRIVAGLGTNSDASVSRYANYDAQTCVKVTGIAGTGEYSTLSWSFSLRGKNNSILWQSPWYYDYDGSHCSPWFRQHNGVYTVVNASEETSLGDAQVWIFTN